MTLQFDPGAYAQVYEAAQNRKLQQDQQNNQTLTNGINAIPQAITGYQEAQDKQKQERMQQLLAGLKFQEQGVDPAGALAYADTGKLPAQPKPMPPPPAPGLAGYSNLNPGMTPPESPYASQSASPVIDAWNNHPDLSQFAPKGAASASTAPAPTGFASLFNQQKPDYGDVINRMAKGDYSGWAKLPTTMQKELESDPRYKELAKAPKAEDLRTPEQVQALFPHLDPAALRAAYPKGVPKEDLGFIGSGQKIDLTAGDKSNQFDQKEWDKIVKEVSPLGATSRTGLGMAVKADYNANRALKTLSKPVVTNQEAHNAMADIASIYQNGTATQYGMSQQGYDSLYGRFQNLSQLVSGNPKDALPDAIKQRLISDLNEMRSTNRDVMKQHFDYYETAQPDLISKHQSQWDNLRKKFEGGIAGGPPSVPSAQTGGTSSMTATNPKTGQKIQSLDGGATWQPM